MRFPVCKLIEKLDVEWQDDNSLPVLLARAQIEALRTAGDAEGRYRAKWLLVRGLYDLGYNAEQVREIIRLVDWMMHLRVDFEERFRTELTAFEEQENMNYVTSFERIGAANALINVLREKCGSFPHTTEVRIRQLTSDDLEQLGRELLRFESLADLESWLDQHPAE